jgi:non-specific protein-tyrosine kinase
MELLCYLRILRRRWVMPAVAVLLSLTVAAVTTARATPVYAASITLVVTAPADGGNAAAAYQAMLLSQERAKSYAKLIRTRAIAENVARALGGGLTAEDLRARITAQAVPDTVLLRAAVTDRSPALAARIGHTLGVEFARYVDGLERSPGNAHPAVRITVADDAEVPTAPASPRPLLNLALGLIVGLIAGVVAAVTREVTDTSVRSVQALREASGGTALGVIEVDARLGRPYTAARDDGDSVSAEAFRRLRTNLRFAGGEHLPRSVVVTAAVAEEGTSTVAVNLAASLADIGRRVILIDADLRRTHLADRLGLDRTVGLTGVLSGDGDLDDALRPWGPPGLSVLPSGPVPDDPSEILASWDVPALLRELEARADIVLVDAPPLLSFTDAAILARACAGALLVTRYGRTRREHVAQAAERLAAVHAVVLGGVLNFAQPVGRLPAGDGALRLEPADGRRLAPQG